MSERVLFRDSLHTPWGFRLTGGKDLKQSLSIQQVKPGSPSHGELEVGDVIVEIQRHDAASLTHKQAQDLIRNSGGSLKLRIIRQGYGGPKNLAHPANFKGTFLLQKLHDSLTDAVIGRGSSSPRAFSPSISYKSPLAANFYDYPEAPKSPSWGIIQMTPKKVPPRRQPEFGWMPEALKNRTHRYVDEHPPPQNAVTSTSYFTPENKFTSIPDYAPSKYIRYFSPPKFENENLYSRLRLVDTPEMAAQTLYSNFPTDSNHNYESLPDNSDRSIHAKSHDELGHDVNSAMTRDAMRNDAMTYDETISEIATHRPTLSEPKTSKITDF